MENNSQKSPMLGDPAINSDVTYVSGLSTILVATIQEAKDRISQIEYIFCSQLFPPVQSKLHNLQKIHFEAREAAQCEFKEKENDLLLQISKVHSEKEQVLEENQLLKLENERLANIGSQPSNCFLKLQEELEEKVAEVNEGKEVQQNLQKLLESNASLIYNYENTVKELEKRVHKLLEKQKSLEFENENLQLDMTRKSKQIEGITGLQRKLHHTIHLKDTEIFQKIVELNEWEDKVKKLNLKLEDVEKKNNELQSALTKNTEELDKAKQMHENLLKKVETKDSEVMNNEQLLKECENKNVQFATKIDDLLNRADELEKLLGQKNKELGDKRSLQEQLQKQIDSFNNGSMRRGLELDEYEKERKSLLDKQKSLEEKVERLQQSLYQRSKEAKESHGGLIKQIEAKDSELHSLKREIKKAAALYENQVASYKKLKSQYLYVCERFGLTRDTMLSHDKKEESETIRENQFPVKFSQGEKITSKVATRESSKPAEEEILEDKIPKLGQLSPQRSTILVPPKGPTSAKSCPPAGTKRPNSYWRDTRSHQNREGPDPHDDFLDTPLENVRRNPAKVMKETNQNLPKPSLITMNFEDSDDETQDMIVDPVPEREKMVPQKAGPSGFKYVEPVRKKADRENLKGVECKQCKKFYDAVLPEGQNSDGSKKNVRCEHHEGVSRHRYRYDPPATPDGFWDIGFETEICFCKTITNSWCRAMDKATDPNLFVNDGSFMERFKQLQQEKEKKEVLEKSKSVSNTFVISIPKPVISKTTLIFKANGSRKAARTLSKIIFFGFTVKFDDRHAGSKSDDGPMKFQKLDEINVSNQSSKLVDNLVEDGKRFGKIIYFGANATIPDVKYVSGLSTILVATIKDVKD